ncbi:M50 family metallopeptidase [Leekyejoonella antrihumi]|uniref:M50 family metallopeptidase n=1 Tax=Leekyejoonella antrihumi TaxID=1660198 RepID=A0A563E3A8_9MICO|nr:M50 family metallopeptidase [Leekyejoonella antrihumi]TWP37007.1 M50 family metallopeptidase [Leekyejoonella antrihumi]
MDDWWRRVVEVTPPADHRIVLAAGLVAVLVIAWSTTWRFARHVVTVVHEGSHGLVALLAGRSLSGIRLHSDSSGLTVSRGKPHGFGMVATLFAGYVGPGLLGLLAAWVLGTGHAIGMLWGLLVLLGLLLLQIRNLYGLWVVMVSAAILVAVTGWLPASWQSGFAYVVAWFLLLAGPWSVVDLQRSRNRGRGRTSDPDQLARMTWPGGGVWAALMLAVDVGCLVVGARLLFLR